MVTYDELTSILERRFDWYSARVTLREALKAASLPEKKSYDPADIEAIASALPGMTTRVEGVVAALRTLVASAPAAPARATKASAAAPQEAAPVEEPEAAAVSEPVPAAEPIAEEADATVDAAEDEAGDEVKEDDAKGRRTRKKK